MKNPQKRRKKWCVSPEKVVRKPWNSRCEPPWSDAELSHKLDDIYTDGATATDWGKFLTDDTDGGDRDPGTVGSTKGPSSHNNPYLTHNGRLCIYKIEEDEEGKVCSVPFPLCNFDARIISAMIVTLGDSTTIEYKIRASMWTLSGFSQVKEVTIPASEFAAMNWPVERLGGDWAVGSGRGIKDNVREAIQLLSAIDGIMSYAK